MILLENARIFDGFNEAVVDGNVLVEGDRIVEVSEKPIRASDDAVKVDVGRRFLMPGLIDAHVHVMVSAVGLRQRVYRRTEYVTAFAIASLRAMLTRGFTTVRDTGGSAPILARATEDGLIDGPRLFPSGRWLTQTGGHGDKRDPEEFDCCSEAHDRFSAVVDGPDAVRRAAREELRLGATQIKIMASGGVSSPSDPLDCVQFFDDEIAAAVEVAELHGTYVTAHCHPKAAIRRCAELGVRCIEHGTFMDDETAAYLGERDVAVVPTLAIVETFGRAPGVTATTLEKLARVREAMLDGIEAMRKAKLRIGLGTDLLGPLQQYQSLEFELRSAMFTPFEILRSATSVNAGILGKPKELGTVAPRAFADLIVVDGDPMRDIRLLGSDGANIPLIMKAGRIYKSTL